MNGGLSRGLLVRFLFSCNTCGKKLTFTLLINRCDCGGTLTLEYNLEYVSRTLTRESLKNRYPTMWRYHELLPIENIENVVSLGEGCTPLLRLTQSERKLPIGKLWVKREEQNPTGSFKARGFSVAISIAKEYGIKKVAVNSNGNAASALAAYAGAAQMDAYVFLPQDCPGLIVDECSRYGADTYLVDGLIHDAGQIIRDGEKVEGWHNLGTSKEPGRVEGKKTMGFEIVEQLNWTFPDVIIYPTGGGSGMIGMWNAFQQLKKLKLVNGDFPRMISVQETGCQPLVNALERDDVITPSHAMVTSNPTGMRVPNPPDGNLVISIIRKSGGTALAVTPDEIIHGQHTLGKQGISSSPEGAATWAALLRLLDQDSIRPTDNVILFNTCHAMKYSPWRSSNNRVIRTYQDWVRHQQDSTN